MAFKLPGQPKSTMDTVLFPKLYLLNLKLLIELLLDLNSFSTYSHYTILTFRHFTCAIDCEIRVVPNI